MQKKITVSFLLALVFHCSLSFAQPLRFAPLPMLSQSEVENSFLPFSNYLSVVTNSEVELVYHNSYQDLIARLLDDQIDLAYLGPLPYVLLTQKNSDFVPVVRFVDQDGERAYTCSLVTFDSSLSSLKGERSPIVALTQVYSTCGYFVTEQLLQQRDVSLDDLPYYYAGQHSECALDVVRGKAQFAGVKTSIARQYQSLGLKIVAESAPVPGFLLIANPRTLKAETISKIQQSLLHLTSLNKQEKSAITAGWGKMLYSGAVAVHSADYDDIRQMLKTIKLPEGDL